MNTGSLTIYEKVQEMKIIPREIVAENDTLNSFLKIPIHFTFNQPFKDHFNIPSITATLLLNNVELSQADEYVGFSIEKNVEDAISKDNHVFKFRFSERTIDFIEKNRNGDIKFRISIAGIIFYKGIHITAKIQTPKQIRSLDGTMRINNYFDFEIPQSQWVKSILPNLNYQNFKLIEVPLNHRKLKEAYEGIVKEFSKADEYFKSQNYNECVGGCRKTMEKLKNALVQIKKISESSSNFEWLSDINYSTFRWIDEMNKANSAITSKPHHAGFDKEFTRNEAESIYLVTLGLLNFVGSLK